MKWSIRACLGGARIWDERGQCAGRLRRNGPRWRAEDAQGGTVAELEREGESGLRLVVKGQPVRALLTLADGCPPIRLPRAQHIAFSLDGAAYELWQDASRLVRVRCGGQLIGEYRPAPRERLSLSCDAPALTLALLACLMAREDDLPIV
ncbi:MAG: hypothetical protein PHY12_11150 [Eubacteriales bacterium]|nr:hypothetical protein [Eubacteriales bacterium]